MAERGGSRVHERWARLRFSVIGALLAAPPAKGALRAALQQLAAREWRHPGTGAPVRFGVSTLERWADHRTGTSSMIRSACCDASGARMPVSRHR